MKLEFIPHDELSFEWRNAIAEMAHAEFGLNPFFTNKIWSTPDYTVLLTVDKNIVTFFQVVVRDVLFNKKKYRAAGIQNLITPPQYRGRHYATFALTESEPFIFETLKAELGLLLCSDTLVPFYQRLGWQNTNATTLYQQENTAKHVWQANTMALLPPFEPIAKDKTTKPLNKTALLGQPTIDLCGLPW